MLSVPYVQQEHPHWCGPAALLMALKFFGVEKSQSELARLLKTTETSGTKEDMIEIVARDLGFEVRTGSGTYDEIVIAIGEGSPVIVAFAEPKEDGDHYAIIIDANSDRIKLLNPEEPTKPQIVLSKEAFVKRWRSRYTAHHQWFMTIKPQKR
jgi:ABC-type bacteriocin/lantibiotic exporter with double-glycine peptidase domain